MELGYKYSGSNEIGRVAWYNNYSGNHIHSVGQKQSNELGIYDMSGNVWEWTYDSYGAYSSDSQIDPIGTESGANRVSRGRGWGDDAGGCGIASRTADFPSDCNALMGFCLCRTAK